jgi:factor associated with neutral sphingomyelinase activation
MSQNDLLKLSTELDMVGRSGEEKHVAQIIFGVRYKELVTMLLNTEDFNPDDILLNHKCKRILPEGEQWGAFVLTQGSLHFYVLMNPKPKAPLHISFQDISLCSKYRFQSKATGLRLDLFSSPWPLIFILETEEQREGIHKFIMNKVKCKNPMDSLAELTDQWVYGRLNNFEYLMACNQLANRSTVDFSQYPVFPWVLSRYQGSGIQLDDPNVFRDLTKHVGELESSRFQRLTVRLS